MAAGLIIIPNYMPALDSNGNPIPGALIYTYANGTTTLKTTYQNAGLTVPHANPVVSDASGVFPALYADNASLNLYTITVTTSGSAPLASYDDIRASVPISSVVQPVSDYILPLLSSSATNLALPLRGYIDGLNLSAAGATSTFGIGTGQATNSTNATIMQLTAAMTKTTGAWAVGTGNGALDTGAIANNAWYHAYLIQRPDTQVVDVLVSTSATTPTLPTSYTLFRRIGAMKTNGSAQWAAFSQVGDEFLWVTPVVDINTATGPTTSALQTLSVPLGLKVTALLASTAFNGGGNSQYVRLYSPDHTVATASATNATMAWTAQGVGAVVSGVASVRTNTSSQIYASGSGFVAAYNLSIETYGWIDRRGSDL